MSIKHARNYSVYKLLLSGIATLAIALQPLASVVHAATSTVDPNSLSGWSFVDDNGHGGTGSFVHGPSGSLHSGSAQLSINASNQGYMLYKPAYGGTKLSDISTLSYKTYVQQGNNTIAPALQLDVDRDVTDGNTAWQGRLVYEPYQNSTVTDSQWQTWNTTGAGKWWFSKPSAFDNTCGQGSPCTFDDIKSAFPNIGIRDVYGGGVGFKAGSGWSVPFVGNVDNFVLNSDTYDFEPDTTGPTVTITSPTANYVRGTVTISGTTDPDTDHYYLVIKDSANHIVYGPGTVTSATINDLSWNTTAFADGTYTIDLEARDTNGNKGPNSVTTKQVTVDNTAPSVPTNGTPNNSYESTNDFDFNWDDSTDANPGITYEFQSSLNSTQTGNVLTTGLWHSPVLPTSMIHSAGAPDGTWYWQVRATDAAGNTSAWSPIWNMTIDSVAPNVSLTSPANNATVTGTSLTQSWASTSTDVDHYVYESFNNAAATSHRWTENMGTHTSKTATNVANATFWWRVTAYDHAGNATVSPLWKLTVSNPVPSVTAQDFGTWDNSANGFMGITAGFGLNDFSHVNSIAVTLSNADGDIVTNTADPDLISLINANNWTQFSSPFVVSGALDDTFCNGGPCWVAGAHTWTAADKPTKVTATVVGKNNLGQTVTKTATNTTLTESPSFADLLPATPTVTVPEVLGVSTGPGMGGSLPVTTFAAVANPSNDVVLASDDSSNSDTTPQTPAKTLGAETNTPSDNNDADTATTPSTGLAWYWWGLIAVAGIGGAWWIIAARRSSAES